MLKDVYRLMGRHIPGPGPFSNLIICEDCGEFREPGTGWTGPCAGMPPRRWSTICLAPGCGSAAAARAMTSAGRFCAFHEAVHRLVCDLINAAVAAALFFAIACLGAARIATIGESTYIKPPEQENR